MRFWQRFLDETHLNCLIREWVAHYARERPHQSLGNRPLPEAGAPDPPVVSFPANGVVCDQRLGGLLRHYRPAARADPHSAFDRRPRPRRAIGPNLARR
jgi:hypothetical protein